MSSKIFKGFAIAAGAGLAIGVGSRFLGSSTLRSSQRRRRVIAMSTPSPDSILRLEPLLDRLDGIESRMSAVEARPIPITDSVSLAELDLRIQRQTNDIETLQVQVSETRQRMAAEVTMVEQRFAEVTSEVPVILESIIGLHVEDLRARLQAEMQESVEATLTTFERTIDSKVSLRIATLEKALIDQSGIITTLSQREADSDMHLQRLISAVERLCERSTARPAAPMPAKDSSFLDMPFDRHLSDAIKRPDSGFRPSIVKEDGDRLRPRTPMTSL